MCCVINYTLVHGLLSAALTCRQNIDDCGLAARCASRLHARKYTINNIKLRFNYYMHTPIKQDDFVSR